MAITTVEPFGINSSNAYTFGSVTATGNVTGNYFIGNGSQLTGISGGGGSSISNGTSNVTVVSSGGNVTVGVGGTPDVAVFATTGEYVTGIVSASGNITGGNLLTTGLISATGNVTGAYFVGNGSQLAGVGAPLTVSQWTTGNISNAIPNVSALRFDTTTGFSVTDIGNNAALISLGSSFKTWEVAGQANLVAVGEDTVEFVAGNGISITTNALSTPQQIKFTATYDNGNVITLLSNLGSNIVSTTGNVTGGNILTDGIASATGNVTGGNVLTGGLVSATANIIGSNINTGGSVSATGNITGGNVNTNNLVGTAITITSTGALNLAPTGNITVNNKNINNLAEPVADQDAATKAYVDAFAQGLNIHDAVYAATTTTLANTTSGTITYNNGSSGVGATLTTTGTFNLIDTANVQTANTRILVKNEANAVTNGVYVWSNATAITRASDYNTVPEVEAGDFMFVLNGNVYANTAWVQTSTVTGIGTAGNNISFTQFSGAAEYTGNTSAGISIVGTVISALVDNTTTAFDGGGNISVKSGAQLTTPNIGAATGTSLSTTGTVTGGNINTGGLVSATGTVTGSSLLGSVVSASANITGGNVLTGGLISAAGNINVGNLNASGLSLTGMISSDLIPISNVIYSLGNTTNRWKDLFLSGNTIILGDTTLSTSGSDFSVSGNISSPANIYGANIIASANISSGNANITTLINTTSVSASGNIRTAGLVSATANITGGNVLTGGLISATANVTGGNLLTAGQISATGNITAGNIIVTGVITDNVGNLELQSAAANGNINLTPNGTGNVYSGSNVLVTGLISASGNITGGNLITAGLASVTGNVNIGNATGVTWANASGARAWTYYNNAASSLDTVFL